MDSTSSFTTQSPDFIVGEDEMTVAIEDQSYVIQEEVAVDTEKAISYMMNNAREEFIVALANPDSGSFYDTLFHTCLYHFLGEKINGV